MKNKSIENEVRKVLVRQASQGHTRDLLADPGGAPTTAQIYGSSFLGQMGPNMKL